MKKLFTFFLFWGFIFFVPLHIYAQYNAANNSFQTSPHHGVLPTGSQPGVNRSSIDCDNSGFYMIDDNGSIFRFQLNNGVAINLGASYRRAGAISLAYCNNLNGGVYTSTLYAASGYSASYYNGNWASAPGTPGILLTNSGGNGNFLFFLGGFNNTDIVRYNGSTYDPIYHGAPFSFAVSDIAVDDSGNIWCVRGPAFDQARTIQVLSPAGQLLKQYDVNFNSDNAYGCFLMNRTLYIGLGDANPVHPNSMIPFTFGGDSAYQGAPITLPPGGWMDMASCSSGLPLDPMQIVSTTTSASCNCAGTYQAHPLNGIPPYTYHWSNGSTSTTSLTNLCGGNYSVTITDSRGVTISNTVNIGGSPGLNPAITADHTVFCATDSAHICASGNFTQYQWNNGETGQCIYTSLSGNYYVTVTDNMGCTAESNHLATTAEPLPPVAISVNGGTLTAYNATSYQWYVNGRPISGANTSSFSAHDAGTYFVQISDANGCLATSSPVLISGIENTPGESYNLNISTVEPGTLLVTGYPEIPGTVINVFDLIGRKLVAAPLTGQATRVDVASLSPGMYPVVVTAPNTKSISRKILVGK